MPRAIEVASNIVPGRVDVRQHHLRFGDVSLGRPLIPGEGSDPITIDAPPLPEHDGENVLSHRMPGRRGGSVMRCGLGEIERDAFTETVEHAHPELRFHVAAFCRLAHPGRPGGFVLCDASALEQDHGQDHNGFDVTLLGCHLEPFEAQLIGRSPLGVAPLQVELS